MNDARKPTFASWAHPSALPSLDEASLTEGQRRRIALFRSVESTVCARIEKLCGSSSIEVTDVGVLVVSASAHALLFEEEDDGEGTTVVIGHRERLHGLLTTMLPPASDVLVDPYADLRDPSPARCVRVMVLDHESMTVMSYGTFVTVTLDRDDMPEA